MWQEGEKLAISKISTTNKFIVAFKSQDGFQCEITTTRNNLAGESKQNGKLTQRCAIITQIDRVEVN